ncbi:hypothetical protein HK104_006410 [Borealophlyctis nickersoniae]|nr:hypothetical protein HK104_006410 [Borealophlyctis nickersoniae]
MGKGIAILLLPLTLLLLLLRPLNANPTPQRPQIVVEQQAARRIVVFGDSGSDNGNVYALTNKTWPTDAYYRVSTMDILSRWLTYITLPSCCRKAAKYPYCGRTQGRFSNGPIWAEYLAASTQSILIDYAHGGATINNSVVQGYTGPHNDVPVMSLLDQIRKHLDSSAGLDNRGDLCVLRGGGNDAYFGFSGGLTVDDSVSSLFGGVDELYNAGFNTFLIFYLSLGNVPYLNTPVGAPARSFFEKWAADFNKAVQTQATRFTSEHRDVTIRIFDTVSFVNTKLTDFKNTRDPCLQASGEVCATPHEYAYWDSLHFSTKAHEVNAKEVQKLMGGLL